MLRDESGIYVAKDKFSEKCLKFVRPRKGTDTSDEYKEKLIFARMNLSRIETLIERAKKAGNDEQLKILQRDLSLFKLKIENYENILNEELKNAPSHKFLKRKIKKRSVDQITDSIRKFIFELKEHCPDKKLFVTKEDMAVCMQVKESLVAWSFMILNREGLLSQAVHRAPHDSCRDPHGYSNNKWWCSDIYYIR